MPPLRLESLGAKQGWRVEGEVVAVTVDGEGVLRGLRLHGEEVALPQTLAPALTPTPTLTPAPNPTPTPTPTLTLGRGGRPAAVPVARADRQR